MRFKSLNAVCFGEMNYKALNDNYQLSSYDGFTECRTISIKCKSCGAKNDFILTLESKNTTNRKIVEIVEKQQNKES